MTKTVGFCRVDLDMAGAIAVQDTEELGGGQSCGPNVERQATGVGAWWWEPAYQGLQLGTKS